MGGRTLQVPIATLTEHVCVVQIMVPGKTNVSLTLSWSTDYDPIAAAEQPGAAKQGAKGDADSEVMPSSAFSRQQQHKSYPRCTCTFSYTYIVYTDLHINIVHMHMDKCVRYNSINVHCVRSLCLC